MKRGKEKRECQIQMERQEQTVKDGQADIVDNINSAVQKKYYS